MVLYSGSGVPEGLLSSGRAIWEAVTSGRKLTAVDKALLLNACRIADRLDALDEEIDGRLISVNSRGDEVINPLISEHRQQYATLAQIFSRMGLGELPKPESGGADKWDELAERRAKRAEKARKAG